MLGLRLRLGLMWSLSFLSYSYSLNLKLLENKKFPNIHGDDSIFYRCIL